MQCKVTIISDDDADNIAQLLESHERYRREIQTWHFGLRSAIFRYKNV